MRPIIIDAATIFDPARLIAVLASVDIRHSEVWVSQRYDHFKEKDFITGFGTDGKFALLPDAQGRFKAEPVEIPKEGELLDPTSYMTGPKILRWALSKGMAVPRDLYKYNQLAIELQQAHDLDHISEAIMLGPPAEFDIRAGRQITEDYLRRSGRTALGPEYAWRLEPYGIGHGLGLILAASANEGAEPFVSHPNLRDNVSTHNYTYYKREKSIEFAHSNPKREDEFTIREQMKDAKALLTSPELVDISQVAFFLDQRERVNYLTGLIEASKDIENRNKDMGVIASKAIGTVALDTFIFGGLPVSTGLVSLFDIKSRYFQSRRDRS